MTYVMPFGSVHEYSGRSPSFQLISPGTVTGLLREQARIRPDAPFIIEQLPGRDTTSWSYGETWSRTVALANTLRDLHGITSSTVVAVLPANSFSSVTTILALMSLGAIAVILNSGSTPHRILEQMDAADTELTLIDDAVEMELGRFTIRLAELVAESGSARSDAPADPEALSPAIVMFTTGSTAAAKAVVQNHYAIALNASALAARHSMSPASTLFCILPIYYANGLEFTIFSTLIAGSKVVVTGKFDPLTAMRICAQHNVNIVSAVPSILDALVEHSRQPPPSTLSYFVSAAAPLAQTTAENVFKKWNSRIVQGYGLTETTNFSTLLPTDLTEVDYHAAMLEHAIPSVGTALFGNEVAVLDEAGNMLPPGVDGEICMRGHSVMMGYLKNAAATDEAFRQGWFHSGDLGRFEQLDGAGNSGAERQFLRISGRLKNIVKVGGHGLSLEEMERLLIARGGVKDAVCFESDTARGNGLVCMVAGSGDVDVVALRSLAADHFGPDLAPAHVVRRDFVPRSPNGKVNRATLAREFLAESDA